MILLDLIEEKWLELVINCITNNMTKQQGEVLWQKK